MNTRLLLKIADAIEMEPQCYNQNTWIYTDALDDFDWNQEAAPFLKPGEGHTCGTRACIAGWAILLTSPEDRPHVDDVPDAARTLLQLKIEESDHLFDGTFTPPDGMSMPEFLRRVAAGESKIFDGQVRMPFVAAN